MFLGVFGSLLGYGGIERANRLTAAALTQLARERMQPCWILSLNDAPGVHSFVVGGLSCSYTGFARNKAKLTIRALGMAFRIRVAFLGHPNFAPIGSLLRGVNSRLRYWIASYGVEVWQPTSGLRRVSLRRAESVTAPSRYTATHLIKTQGLDPAKVTLLPLCLDPGFRNCTPGQRQKSAPSSSQILTVGRLLHSEPGKGVDTVIQALRHVIQAVPDARYVVVGDGDERPRLEELAKENGVGRRVMFLGHLNESELRERYLEADVFAMPSRQEGFGIVFLEAMSFGKPVVAAAFGGTPDIVVDGQTGFLVEYGNVRMVADRLIQLLRDADLRKRMGDSGRERVETNYTFAEFRGRLSSLLGPASDLN
jgi:phosphatidyl-myo-inositol dimannoside synthase